MGVHVSQCDLSRGRQRHNKLVSRQKLARTDGENNMTTLIEIHAFLLGESALEGVQFGDKHQTRKGAFWWRTLLRKAIEREKANPRNEAEVINDLTPTRRSCVTCKFEHYDKREAPCLPCRFYSNWEPKPDGCEDIRNAFTDKRFSI